MYISIVQFFKRSVNGHIFRGKRRLVKPVTKKAVEQMRLDFERQERTMLLLRHPYLSLEESSGHAKELGKREKKIIQWNAAQTMSKMKSHITLQDRLNHLKVKEAWD